MHLINKYGWFYLMLACVLLLSLYEGKAQDDSCPIPKPRESTSLQQSPAPGKIQISAEQVQASVRGKARLQGNVQFEQDEKTFRADTIAYDPDTRTMYGKGDVQYTTCGSDNPDWFLSAEKFFLNEEELAVADTWFVFGNTQVFYLPYYRFPLNKENKSGLLAPKIQQSDSTGLDLEVPVYFSLAQNFDTTLGPRLLTKRGLQLNSNTRYLSYLGESQLHGDWLSDSKYPHDRYSYKFQHSRAGKRARVELLYQNVSDLDYIDDLSTNLQRTQTGNYLPNYASLDYVWSGWQFKLSANGFRRADVDANDPNLYKRIPSVSLGKQFFGGFGQWDFASNFTRFESQQSNTSDPDGRRFNTQLEWKLPLLSAGIQLTPSIKLRHTRYHVERRRDEPKRTIHRTVPSFGLRGKLIFEKTQQGYRRTLEPEVYYLKVPYRNQSDIPVYDSIRPDFQFNELFLDNRFRGTDRIADTDQISLALTHRVLHERSGQEVIRAQLGQIFYFKKSRVTLPGETNPPDSKSDTVGALTLNLNNKLSFTNTLVWNHELDTIHRATSRLSFNAGNNRLINFFYRHQRKQHRQIGLSLSMPVADRWNVVAATSHDTYNKRNLSTLLGFEYRTCCWRLRLLGQRYLKDLTGDRTLLNGNAEYDHLVGFELNFNQFGTLDTNIQPILQQAIDGYVTD